MKVSVTPVSSKEVSDYWFHLHFLLTRCTETAAKLLMPPLLSKFRVINGDGCLRFCVQPKHLQNPSGRMTVLMFSVFTVSKQYVSVVNDVV
jgi:hypothetical protein